MSLPFRSTAAAALAAVAISAGAFAAADALTQLGITPAAAKEAWMAGVGSGWFDYGLAAPAFKKAPVALRVQLAEGAVAWAKSHTATPEFKAAYAKLRENRRPRAPEFKGTPEEEQARQREQLAKDQAKAAEEMKKVVASLPAEQRPQMEAAMKQGLAAAAQMDTPEMRKMILDGIRMQREDQTRRYQEALQKWQEEYPESPAPVLARRLQKFLDVTGSVDFDAKLQARDGKMVFVNAEYESRPSEWKMYYRAGREPIAAARTAVQAWLTELRR
jgi:flagellar biosynthesis GTPase FlhF